MSMEGQPQYPHSTPYQISIQQFSQRFSQAKESTDAFNRNFTITTDIQTKKRCILKSYQTQQQNLKAVLQNIENYAQLRSLEGLSKMVAFYRDENLVVAAFEFDDLMLEEYLKEHKYVGYRNQFYLCLLAEISKILGRIGELAIDVENISLENVLIYTEDHCMKVKIFFDQREKIYDKIFEGAKIFWSPQKLKSQLQQQQQQQFDWLSQLVYQLGMMFLDILYKVEKDEQQNQVDNITLFNRDRPLSRIVQESQNKNYYIFGENGAVQVDVGRIGRQIEYLIGLHNAVIDGYIGAINKMIAPAANRIKCEHLLGEVSKIGQISTVKNHPQYETPPKSPKTPTSQQKQETHQQYISQTTLETDIAQKEFQSLSTTAKIDIPRQKIFSSLKVNERVKSKLQTFMLKIENSANACSKQYYNKTQYYGEIDQISQTRRGLGIYICQNKDIYFGSWQQNNLIEGCYIFNNGQCYQGTAKGGKQGFGTYYYNNGNIYDGDWRDDVKCGKGIMKYPNGDVYEGMWSKGKKNGQGCYRYHSGIVYEGAFVNGKKNGFGVITFPEGTKIQANWNSTYIQGQGKVFYSNGDYYEGNYHLSQKHGNGLYFWEECQYEGNFQKDCMEGHAKIKYNALEYYIGKIKNGKKDGKGLYHYENNDEFEGDWKNDHKICGIYKYGDGIVFDGRFKNNEIYSGVMKYGNGELYEGEFKNGLRNGFGVYINQNGEKYEGQWVNDMAEGTS